MTLLPFRLHNKLKLLTLFPVFSVSLFLKLDVQGIKKTVTKATNILGLCSDTPFGFGLKYKMCAVVQRACPSHVKLRRKFFSCRNSYATGVTVI